MVFEQALADYDVAKKICGLLIKAESLRRELASRIETTASVVCHLKVAD